MRKKSIKPIPDLIIYLGMIVLGALIVYMRMELYLKLLFLFFCFSCGFLYEVWIKKAKGLYLLKSGDGKKKNYSTHGESSRGG